jgi:3'-phosphoadenosine 5'-phosphosulfate sulfotransferase (PAPS reductase)/FAD synthetase
MSYHVSVSLAGVEILSEIFDSSLELDAIRRAIFVVRRRDNIPIEISLDVVAKECLIVCISGGRSSATMAYLIKKRFSHKYHIVFVFANTSREKEETLVFLNECDKRWNLGVVWVEAVVHHGSRKASTHRVVTFETAARHGEVFEEVIKKYGIPNKKFLHCTRELKTNPSNSYCRSIGFRGALKAIGYRKDEPKRVNLIKAAENGQWYPLFEWGIKKPDVAVFWKAQPFDLQLEDFDGNCELCHKKSKRKQLTQLKRNPSSADWVMDMENKYSYVKPKKKQHEPGPVRFFRSSESIYELVAQSKEPFEEAVDQSMITNGAEFDYEMDDEDEGCGGNSCEPFALD